MKFFVCTTAAAILVGGTALAHEVIHNGHDHAHAADCGHLAVEHEGHVDYVHDGHLHMAHGDHVDEHVISVSTNNPASEALVARVDAKGHKHGAGGATPEPHQMVQHGDHFDFVHDGRLHFVHGDHVDDHGALKVVAAQK